MQLEFGPVVVTWELPEGIRTPIGVAWWNLNGENVYVTQCPVRFHRPGSGYEVLVPADFEFDGASVPQEFWDVEGFAPIGQHLWAALAHDWLCEESKAGRFDRELADSVFSVLLKHTGVPTRRARLMAAAVKLYRLITEYFGAE